MLPDLDRNIWCVLGLLFDITDTDKTIKYLSQSVKDNHKIVLCTPNINYIILALEDSSFRESSFNCDLSVADGMPIIWVAKLLGIPLVSRVSGSGLILDMCAQKSESKLSLFLFGGENGVAKLAAKRVNEMNGKLSAVGFSSPGHGSVKEMSREDIILDINKHHPDFLLVALGAKKGQEWIDFNKDKLNSKIISHLGATINFLADTVKRAPTWMQRSGFEWLWRIIEEPGLWSRYFRDGLKLSRLLITRVIPYWWFLQHHKKQQITSKVTNVELVNDNHNVIIKVAGVVTTNQLAEIRPVFKKVILDNKNIVIDLANVEYIDSAFIALLMLVRKHVINNGRRFTLEKSNPIVNKIIYYNCAEFIQ